MVGSSGSCVTSSPSKCLAGEEEAAGMRAGNGFGHGGQGPVDLTFVLESVAQDLDLQGLAFVPAGEDSAGQGQVVINWVTVVGFPVAAARRPIFDDPRRRQ